VECESQAIRGKVVGGNSADSMLRFRLERGGDRMKHCWKMKRRQRAHLGSMGRKCDTTRQNDDVGRRRVATGEGKGRRQH
jgi:hypothetical protein